MRIMRFCIVLIIPYFFQIAFAQQADIVFEYGSADELKGVSKIYVYTGAEFEVRNDIVKNIQERLDSVLITDHAEDAEVILLYGSSSNTYFSGIETKGKTITSGSVQGQSQDIGDVAVGQGRYSSQSETQSRSTPEYTTITTGNGLVIKPLKDSRVRVLMEFKGSKGTSSTDGPGMVLLRSIFEKKPSTNFAKDFVKAYKKASGEK
jgi:hypothetical protein